MSGSIVYKVRFFREPNTRFRTRLGITKANISSSYSMVIPRARKPGRTLSHAA
jgi:hypothetical protein